MTDGLEALSIRDAGFGLRRRQIRSLDLTLAALERIGMYDRQLNAFVKLEPDAALKAAAIADRELDAGLDRGPMHGIPYALKDVIDVCGLPTRCHSRLQPVMGAQVDAAVVGRLKNGGAIMLGKLATHEFAIGGPSEDLLFPPARNPWNLDYIPGGSSSGSGAAVGAGFVRVALGTDTGGSVRWPAAWCGVYGLKPSRGLISRRGIFPLSPSLDHCGVLGWSVDDVALSLEVIAGHDEHDPDSLLAPSYLFSAKIGFDLNGLRLAWPRHIYAQDSTDPEIVACMDKAAERLLHLGATVDEVEMPLYDKMADCARLIMAAEAFAVHEANLRDQPEAFGQRTFTYLIGGAVLSSDDLTRALRIGGGFSVELNEGTLRRYDAILIPSVLNRVTRFDAYSPQAGPPVTLCTSPFNLSGNPALSVPFGCDSDGLPLGFQLVGRAFGENTLFQIAAAFENSRSVPRRRPDHRSWTRL